MQRYVRMVAEHAGDRSDPPDPRWKIVLDGIDTGDKLKPQVCFGYASEVGDDGVSVKKWPFLLEPPKSNRSARINFGPLAEPQYEAVNIFDREFRIDNFFSRGSGDDVSTYRITKIEVLLQAVMPQMR